ncbi:hypothetical protein GCM10023169_27920 [Georgenia halophila]|uniref:MobA-like NTP transferase domain-containing protein n=1 Tax=Georgenia halophila TaxID=620889 RepID=A0ABP8LG01_9MICO
MARFDAIVLAGGRARRLGGVSKPDVAVAGRRLLDHALEATAGAGRVVVVAPAAVAVPDGVTRTLEDPPHGGPVAGLAAGLAALDSDDGSSGDDRDGDTAELVLVLACDGPYVATAVPRLLAALRTDDEDQPDGAVLVDGDDRAQWLTAVYRAVALRERVAEQAREQTGESMHALVSQLRLVGVPAREHEADDVDTWDDLPDG